MRRTCVGKKKNGEPCQGPAVNGADKCRMHLGKKTAGVKLAYQAEQMLARLDAPPVQDPLGELQKLAGQVIAWKDAMAEQVNMLRSVRYSTDGGEQLRAEVALFERAMDRCERTLTAIARLNIDERLQAIREAQAAVFIAAFERSLAVIPEEQRAVALGQLRTELTAITGDAA